MADRTMTLAVADDTFDRLQRRAVQAHRTVEDEARHLMETVLAAPPGLPDDLAVLLDAFALLDSSRLREIAARSPATEDAAVLAALTEKRAASGLTPAEEQLVQDLIERADRAVLVRAKALALLHARGEDIRALTGAA
ncbi:MAG: hypothetical protein IT340_21520 [Chloroflexi bacterium]|nr:hypothetical protein [Chloroflexota bacterium]